MATSNNKFKVYFNDNVNEMVLLQTFTNLSTAKTYSKKQIGKLVLDSDNVDVFADASTARIEVYQGDVLSILGGDPVMNEPVFATPYFYI